MSKHKDFAQERKSSGISPINSTPELAGEYPKSHVGYWRARLTTRSNDQFYVRIRFSGIQHWWPLHTVNRADAAEKARAIWDSLQKHGFEITEAKFKPWTVSPRAHKQIVTLGDFISAAKAVAVVRPTTFTTYERKLRFLASQIAQVKPTNARKGMRGSMKWREKVDRMLLSEITPTRVSEWRVRYLSRFNDQPLKRQQAQSTVISIIRNAKALFAAKILNALGPEARSKLPTPLPFERVDVGKRPRVRYKSKVNAGALAAAAWNELKPNEPELFKVFLLAFGAGLRRGEIDRLTWKAFDWNRGTLNIEPTEYGIAKTESSHDEIDLGQDLIDYFKAEMGNTSGEFVIVSAAQPVAASHWNRYRCDCTFKRLLDWLRLKGVVSRNPLHTLRKEFGSLVNQKFGIYAASAALRHSNIAITREAYVDKKERIALDISELISQNDRAEAVKRLEQKF